MLRIMSFLVLLIISQVSFAEVSYSTIAANVVSVSGWSYSSSGGATIYNSMTDYAEWYRSTHGYNSYDNCYRAHVYSSFDEWVCTFRATGYTDSRSFYELKNYLTSYQCDSGYFLSDASGNPSSSGQYCTIGSDSCESKAGTSVYFWVSKVSAPSTVCSGTCLASISGSWGDSPDADPESYTQHQYTYSGETAECTADSGFVDEAAAFAANAAAAERERLAKIEKAIADAKTACGGEGTYTTGTFNGSTVVTCKGTGTETAVNSTSTSTTVTNPDGTTTTTTTTTSNNTSSTNNSSTIINSDGSTSSSGGSSGSSSGTTTTSVTRDAAGNIISSTTSGSETTEDSSGTFDGNGTGSALSDLLADKEDINSMIESGGPGIPAGSDGFGITDTWYWPAGSCTPMVVDVSIDNLTGSIRGDSMCEYWNSVANPVFTWVLYLMTALYVYFLWDRTLSDVAKAG